ncbi:hypothetical protein GQ42DRAFT_171273, partial [Ramicandelaber brevisporus]
HLYPSTIDTYISLRLFSQHIRIYAHFAHLQTSTAISYSISSLPCCFSMSKRSAASINKAAPPVASATVNIQTSVTTASSRGRATHAGRVDSGGMASNAIDTGTTSMQQSFSSPQPPQFSSIADSVKLRQRGDPSQSRADNDFISRGLAKASLNEQAEDVSTAQQPQPQPQPQPQLEGSELEKRIYMRVLAMNKRHSGDPGLSKFNGSFDQDALFKEHSERVRQQVSGHAILGSICEMYVEIYDSTYASWCLDEIGLGDLGEDEVKRILVLGLVSLQSNAIRLQSLAISLEAARILCSNDFEQQPEFATAIRLLLGDSHANLAFKGPTGLPPGATRLNWLLCLFDDALNLGGIHDVDKLKVEIPEAELTTAELVALLHSDLLCSNPAERMRSIEVIKTGLEGNCIGPDTDTPAIPIYDVNNIMKNLLRRRPKGLTAFKKLATVTTSTFFTHLAAELRTKKNGQFAGKDEAEVANMIRHQVSGDDYYYLTEQINEVFESMSLDDLDYDVDVIVTSIMENVGSRLVSKLSTGNPLMLTGAAAGIDQIIHDSMRHAVNEAVATCRHTTEQENEHFFRYNYFGPIFDVDERVYGNSVSISYKQRLDLAVAVSRAGYIRPSFYIKVEYMAWPNNYLESTGIDTDLGVPVLIGGFKKTRSELYIDEQNLVELAGLEGAKLVLLCVPKDATDFSEAEALRWHTVLADGEPALHYGESRLRLIKLDGNLAGCMVYREYDTRTVQLDVTAATPSDQIEVTPKLFDGIIEHLTVLHGSVAPASRSIERMAREAQAANFEANKSAFISTNTARFVFVK